MPVTKRKKFTRQRGSMTHGWGAKKKHRGSGNRGGFGMAGTGKRADQKKPSIINEYGLDVYFGKHGFTRPSGKKEVNATNLSYIEENLDKLLASNKAKKDAGIIIVNLSELGYDKLLGSGSVSRKLKITAKSFSKGAIKKIEEAGGDWQKVREKGLDK